MECGQSFPSQPFVMLTVDQFVGCDGRPPERQKQDSHVYRKTGTFASDFSEKSDSSLNKRRSLRNCEKGMEFLTCDGFEDEEGR